MAIAHPSRRGRVAEAIAVTAVYGLVAYFLTSPLFDSPGDTLLDPKSITTWLLTPNTDLFIWALSWDWHALTTQPLSLFDANILYPTEGSLAAVYARLGHLPIFGPLRALGGNPVAAHQLNMLANFALSGAALYALLRHCGAARGAAFFGGFVYALCPARISAAATPSLVAGQYLPLALIFLHRAVHAPGWKNVALATLFFVWQASCALVYVYLIPMVAFAFALYTALVRSSRAGAPRAVAVAVLSTLAIGLLIAPTVAAVADGRLDAPAGLGPPGFFLFGAAHSWSDYLSRATFFNPSGQANLVATPLYLGWATVAAALLFPALRRRGAVWGGGALALCAALAAALTFGPRGPLTAIWELLAAVTPGATTLLLPSHFGFVVILAAAVFAGLGLDRALSTLPWTAARLVLVTVLVVAAAWEFRLLRGEHGIAVAPRSPHAPRIYSVLRDRPAGSILEIPIDNCRLDSNIAKSRTMFDSTFHWRPLLNGLGELPQAHRAEIDLLVSVLPDPRAVRLLARIADLRHIVAHASAMPVAERYTWMAVEEIREVGFADGRFLMEITGDIGPSLTERFRALDLQDTTLLDNPVAPVAASGQEMEIAVALGTRAAAPRIPIVARAVVRNPSDRPWPVLGGPLRRRVGIVHYWEDESGERIGAEPEHTRLPFDLGPGESISFPFCTSPPLGEGLVYLRAAVVQGDQWFRGEPGRTALELRPFQRMDPG